MLSGQTLARDKRCGTKPIQGRSQGITAPKDDHAAIGGGYKDLVVAMVAACGQKEDGGERNGEAKLAK